jgi:isocitrate lyase
MSAYAELQEAEFAEEANGYTATRHQREVGTGYFDQVSQVISAGESSTLLYKAPLKPSNFIRANINNVGDCQ